jgi:rRNA maturation protein Nop10
MPSVQQKVEGRGVQCHHCGKKVYVPTSVINREKVFHGSEAPDELRLISLVFTLRCRSCEREGIYTMNQIIDCGLSSQPAVLP